MHPVYADLPETIFETMSRLAREHGAINLGQGFPDDPGPADVREVAARALVEGDNQYPSMMGVPSLREAVASHYRHHQGLTLDPTSEVMITSGATEALAVALLATIEPGDEVVVFEPAYDAYRPLIQRAGGRVRTVSLRPPDFRIREEALVRAFSDRTRAVILNNPLNPSATVFPEADLALLARCCERHDAIAICDEVWEHVIFDGRVHRPLMALPGMRERTVKIGSAGKIFSLTGWKVGFVMAAPPLLQVLSRAHQFLTYTTPPNLQHGVAHGLRKDDSYFQDMRRTLTRSRDLLTSGLRRLGFEVLPSAATYFLNVDIGERDDVTFCRDLIGTCGVAAIPVSAFYARGEVRNVVRFCFAKSDRTIGEALERLSRARPI